MRRSLAPSTAVKELNATLSNRRRTDTNYHENSDDDDDDDYDDDDDDIIIIKLLTRLHLHFLTQIYDRT